MRKRMFSLVLALCLCLTLLPTVALADGPDADTSWYNAENSSFTISTEAQLLGLASLVNGGTDFSGKTVTLAQNITLTASSWTPIGNGSRNDSGYMGNAFKGTFDGDNHSISGLTISSGSGDTALGLFGVVDGGTVKNLTLSNVQISTTDNKNTGAAIGLMVGGATAENITVSGTVTGKDGVGGIVGRMTIEGTIKNCENNATVSATGKAGGIVGAAYYTAENKEMTISGCTNTGIVTSTAGYVGGIAGLSAAKITNCINTADVTGNGTSIGGIVGEQANYGSVTGCANSGNVKNNNSANDAYGNGGIVGWVRYPNESTDYPLKAVIEVKNNSNSGSVTGGSDAGGIVGTVYNAANVTGNENTTSSLSSSNFIAGIIGNFQNTETLKQGTGGNEIPQKELNCSNNVSTTTLEQMGGTGSCKALDVYNNPGDKNEGKIENNANAVWAAQIGTTKYATLEAAIAAANSGDTIKLLRDVTDAEGIKVDEGKNFTIDFNRHTYTVNKPGEGSKGTQTNGFQLLKDSTITFKNGTINIAADNKDLTGDAADRAIKILIQNYCNLTLDNMVIDGSNLCVAKNPYVVSNNFGNVTIKDTTITAADNCFAFDVFASGGSNYTAVKVTVTNSTINGRVDVARSSADTAKTHTNTLVIESGTFNGEIKVTDHENSAVLISGGTFNGALNVSGNDNKTVSISGGTFSTDPSDYAAEGYQVRQNSDGSYSVGNEQNDLAWLLPVLGALEKAPFDDVKTSDWFYDDVQYAYDNGLMTGTASRTFSPDAAVTRGMVMTILARREGIKTDRYSPWYAAGVEWAVVNGISDGTNPEAEITREQLAAMLYRYAKLKGYDLSGTALTGFSDANSVSGYAVSAMQWAVGSGLMNGSNGRLTPRATATRAQLAAMLHRFFG